MAARGVLERRRGRYRPAVLRDIRRGGVVLRPAASLGAPVLAVCLCLAAASAQAQAGFAEETGEASWYGAEFHGRPTASGEPYDMEAMTAAHRTLPFGSLVLVTNLADGRQVVVRVNDRGPFARGRILDLSAAAARVLGLDRTGTARVSLGPAPAGAAPGAYPPGKAAARPAGFAAPASGATAARVQVGSYREAANARAAAESLARLGVTAALERPGDAWQVVVYVAEADLDRLLSVLEAAGWKGSVVRRGLRAP